MTKCACGCGEEIIPKRHHSWLGTPKYIHGHNSKANKSLTVFKKGQTPWNKGKKNIYSEEYRKKISESKKGNKNNLGKHWNKKNPITPLHLLIRTCYKYDEWRLHVFGRDSYTCQECGERGVYFEAHHKKRFSDIIKENNIKTFEEAIFCDELWDINNGITLCEKCHNKYRKVN